VSTQGDFPPGKIAGSPTHERWQEEEEGGIGIIEEQWEGGKGGERIAFRIKRESAAGVKKRRGFTGLRWKEGRPHLCRTRGHRTCCEWGKKMELWCRKRNALTTTT